MFQVQQVRQGRRDRRRDGDGDPAEIKRRSRSEGPGGRRVAQSMDVGTSNNNKSTKPSNSGASYNNFDKRAGGRASPGSDDGGGRYNVGQRGATPSDSDSDSDRAVWMKNPLLVRRVKKNKEKRNSTTDSGSNQNQTPSQANSSGYSQLGQRNTNRESWVYLAPEGTPLPGSEDVS